MFGEFNVGMLCTNSHSSQDMFDPDDKILVFKGFIMFPIVIAMRKLKLKVDADGTRQVMYMVSPCVRL